LILLCPHYYFLFVLFHHGLGIIENVCGEDAPLEIRDDELVREFEQSLARLLLK